jgi:hypothetical protein
VKRFCPLEPKLCGNGVWKVLYNNASFCLICQTISLQRIYPVSDWSNTKIQIYGLSNVSIQLKRDFLHRKKTLDPLKKILECVATRMQAIRNPRWMSLPLIGQDIYTFHRTTICEVTRPARNVPLNSNPTWQPQPLIGCDIRTVFPKTT